MKMRFRTDGSHYADLKTQGWAWDNDSDDEKSYSRCFHDNFEKEEYKKEWDSVPRAEPGDVWRIHWGGGKHPDDPGYVQGPVAGYAICCPGCGHVHYWTTSNNCSAPRREYTYKNPDGSDGYGSVCIHSGVSSCWNWTGSAEEGTLSATPSLQVVAINPGDCNWHGYITNGDIHT